MFAYYELLDGLALGTTVTDTEAGSTFLTQQREVHAPVAAFSPGFDSPYREVSPNTNASSYFFVIHGVGFFCGCFIILPH